jgi:hypothetical protein
MVCMVCNVVCMISTHLGLRVGLWGLGYGRLVLNVFSSKRLYYMWGPLSYGGLRAYSIVWHSSMARVAAQVNYFMEPLSFVTKTHTYWPVSVAILWYYDYHRIPSSKLLPSRSYFKWWCNTIVNHSPMWQGDSVALFILIELRRWYNHYRRLSSSQLRSLSLKNDNDLVTMMIQSLLSAVIVATKVIIIKKWFVMVLHIPIVYDDVIQ